MAAAKPAARVTEADIAALTKDMLPTAARQQLSTLVTELNGIAKALRAEIVHVDDEDLPAALSMWVDRIADDLGNMECRRYPASPTETSR
jgi:hypothetical protein